ncbi:hypothetical protein PENSPDRAFT_650974 [Peniophora sp. CONT]|nr:hypothetical protein PENSPDRAFT_650974 [Peniophora sp. CONT]
MIFILVALDKIHYSRGPQVLSNVQALPESRQRREVVSVTFEVDVERGGLQSPSEAHAMATLNHCDRRGDDPEYMKQFDSRDRL